MTSRTVLRSIGLTVAASTLAALMATGAVRAQTADPDAPPAISVRYLDLDLHHEAGAEAMYRRLDQAAIVACGGRPDPRLLVERDAFYTCRKESIDRAVSQLNAPLVTAAAGRSKSTQFAARK